MLWMYDQLILASIFSDSFALLYLHDLDICREDKILLHVFAKKIIT